jgi:hypothetical protein
MPRCDLSIEQRREIERQIQVLIKESEGKEAKLSTGFPPSNDVRSVCCD